LTFSLCQIWYMDGIYVVLRDIAYVYGRGEGTTMRGGLEGWLPATLWFT